MTTTDRPCECGRIIDGSRSLPASAYVACSTCRREYNRTKRNKLHGPVRLPSGVAETLTQQGRANLAKELLNHMRESEQRSPDMNYFDEWQALYLLVAKEAQRP